MTDFEMLAPTSLAEAIAALDTEDPAVRPFAGGTALMLMMKSGVFTPSTLVNLAGLESRYHGIRPVEGGLEIGAMASLSRIERDAEVARLVPVIPRAMKRLSNVRVRNVARIGGNLAHGDPHMDMPPVLAALRATLTAAGPEGERRIAVEDLFSGYYETVLAQGEVIATVSIPDPSGWRTTYIKTCTRTHDDWPTLGVAVSIRQQDGEIADSRVMISAATEKLTRAIEAEAALKGARPSTALASEAGDAAADSVETIEDARGSAAYKRELVRVQLRRAIEQLLGEEAPR